MKNVILSAALIFGAVIPTYAADPSPIVELYKKVTPSLVVVQYNFAGEMRRREIGCAGVVINNDGLVMAPMAIFNPEIPDEQMKEFKIILPQENDDPVEIDATFLGRDERTNLAFFKPAKSGDTKWVPVQFEKSEFQVGDTVRSVGLLSKAAGYRTYVNTATISAKLRGEFPQLLVDGNLAAVGSPVFNSEGKAIGFVNFQQDQPPIINDPRVQLNAVKNPPMTFTAVSDFEISLKDVPVAGQPLKLPWIGVGEFTGLKKDVAEFFGLNNTPAVQIADVVPKSAADKAGLKQGMIITKVDGKPLTRGDEPEELPMILRRQLIQHKVGDVVTFSVITGKDEPVKDIAITMEEMPKRANLAARSFFEDLGFGARELVFNDTYAKKLAADTKGVIVTLIKPSSSAAAAKLEREDVITELNGKPFAGIEEFKKNLEAFRKENPKQAVVMVVQRDGSTEVIRMEPPQ